jgi:hypothetical protein
MFIVVLGLGTGRVWENIAKVERNLRSFNSPRLARVNYGVNSLLHAGRCENLPSLSSRIPQAAPSLGRACRRTHMRLDIYV